MRIHRFGLALAALVAVQFLASGCILTPTIEDRVVELVVTNSVTTTLHASGSTNVLTSNPSSSLIPTSDILSAIDDAGIELDSLVSISLQKVDYRVTTPDPVAARTINGSIRIGFGSSASVTPGTTLISSFTGGAGAVTPWTNVALTPAGVTLINNTLTTLLGELKSHTAATHYVGYDATGTAAGGGTTNFDYEVRLTMNVVGKVKTKTLTSK